jgi:hypothetical protein
MLRTLARKRFTRDQSVSWIRAHDRAGQPMRVASVAH